MLSQWTAINDDHGPTPIALDREAGTIGTARLRGSAINRIRSPFAP